MLLPKQVPPYLQGFVAQTGRSHKDPVNPGGQLQNQEPVATSTSDATNCMKTEYRVAENGKSYTRADACATQLRETASSWGLRKTMRAEQERLQDLGVITSL